METPGLQALAAEAMMRRHPISRAEAVRRLKFQDAASEITEAIHNVLGDRGGGMWFDHQDRGRLKIGVVLRPVAIPDAEVDRVKDLLVAQGVSGDADLVPVEHSLQELERAHSALTDELLDLYHTGKISSGLSTRENALHIDMATTVTRADRARLQQVAERAPVRVQLRQTEHQTMAVTQT